MYDRGQSMEFATCDHYMRIIFVSPLGAIVVCCARYSEVNFDECVTVPGYERLGSIAKCLPGSGHYPTPVVGHRPTTRRNCEAKQRRL